VITWHGARKSGHFYFENRELADAAYNRLAKDLLVQAAYDALVASEQPRA
jgi:hypothetical protein